MASALGIARHIGSPTKKHTGFVALRINRLTRLNQPLTEALLYLLVYLIHVETRCTAPAAGSAAFGPRACRSSSIGSEDLSYKIYILPPLRSHLHLSNFSLLHSLSPTRPKQVLSVSLTPLGRRSPSFSSDPPFSLVIIPSVLNHALLALSCLQNGYHTKVQCGPQAAEA